jgi:hypothetical protein
MCRLFPYRLFPYRLFPYRLFPYRLVPYRHYLHVAVAAPKPQKTVAPQPRKHARQATPIVHVYLARARSTEATPAYQLTGTVPRPSDGRRRLSRGMCPGLDVSYVRVDCETGSQECVLGNTRRATVDSDSMGCVEIFYVFKPRGRDICRE